MSTPSTTAGPAAARSVLRPARPLPPALGFVTVVVAAALFGTLGPVSRFAYDAGLDPASFLAWRALVGLAGVVLFVAWRVRRGHTDLVRSHHLSTRARATLGLAAVMGFTLNLCMFFAFDRVTVALALLGFYTYPAMVAIGNMALGRERLDPTRAAALGLALVGMIAVVASQLDPAAGVRVDALGLGLALGAAVSQTIFVLISRDGYRDVPTEQAMAVVLAVTLVGSIVVATVSGTVGTFTFPLETPSVLPLLLFTGVFTAAIPSLGFLAGIRSIGGTRAGILMLFEPVVGVALAAWLLGEDLVPIQLVGAVAILAAAVVLQRGSRDEPGVAESVVIHSGP